MGRPVLAPVQQLICIHPSQYLCLHTSDHTVTMIISLFSDVSIRSFLCLEPCMRFRQNGARRKERRMTTNHLEMQTERLPRREGPMLGPLSRKALAITMIATSLGFVLVQLDVSIVNVALAQIGIELRTEVAGLQWVIDSYTLLFASLLLFVGALADRIGARKAFVGGFALFLIASLACGLAPIPAVLIGARAIQGIGAAFLVPCSLALLDHACRDDAI